MFHSVKQHGPASVNCFQMRQKIALRSDIFQKYILIIGPTKYSDLVPWLNICFVFCIDTDGTQNWSVGSRFLVANPSE